MRRPSRRRFTRRALVLKLVLLFVLAGSRSVAAAGLSEADEEDETFAGDDSACLKGLLNAVREQEDEEDSNALVTTWTATALASPCNFTSTLRGISCNGSRVAVLSLPGANLVGTLPSSLSLCNHLQTLDLASNSLTGGLPHELGELSHLSTLSLSNNQLAGPIPYELATCVSLTWLDLHQNQLSGSIPAQIGLLPLRYFDVSNNNLSGSIPSTLSNTTSTGPPRFNASFFDQNPNLYGFPLNPYPSSPQQRSSSSSSSSPQNEWGLSIYGIVGLAVTASLMSIIILYCFATTVFEWRTRRREMRERECRRKKVLKKENCEASFGWKDVLDCL